MLTKQLILANVIALQIAGFGPELHELERRGLLPRGASGVTKIADAIKPERFTSYTQQLTEEKSRLIQSGVLVRDAALDALLVGGGLTFNAPSWKDLDNDVENTSTDNDASDSTPNKIGSAQEIAVRLSRNNSWSAMALVATLAGSDPMQAVASRVADYWTRRLQAVFVAVMQGVLRDNAKAPTASEHVQNDLTIDVSDVAYEAGVTDFQTESFIDAAGTLGDSDDDVSIVFMHSVVFQRAQKNNLIDFIPDARGEVNIPTFLGREVVKDDGMPNTAGVYETWLFGPGAVRLGVGTPDVPTEIDRKPAAGDGGGQDVLHNRVEWCLHPTGHAYVGTPPDGGPDNDNAANDLAHEDSWARRFTERKQIKIARLITRES